MSAHDDDGRALRAAEDARMARELGPDAGYWFGRAACGSPMLAAFIDAGEWGAFWSAEGLVERALSFVMIWLALIMGAVVALALGALVFPAAHAIWRSFVPVK